MIPEDIAEHFALTNNTTPVIGTLREVLDNDTKPIDKIYLNGLGTTEGKSGGASIMLKTGMEVAQYYTVFNYGPPIPHKA